MMNLKNYKFYQMDQNEVQKVLQTETTGLSREEAGKRLAHLGKNELSEGKKDPVLLLFLRQFKDFLVLVLFAAATLSITMGDAKSAVVIFSVLLLNALLGVTQQVKAEKSLGSLKALAAPTAKVIREGQIERIPASMVTVGDRILLEAGDAVCADARVIESSSLKVNESMLTGESLDVEKYAETIHGDCPLADRTNMVYSASYITNGRATCIVTHTGMQTEVGNIAALLQNTKERSTPLQKSLDAFGKKLSIAILGLCFLLFISSILQGLPPMDSFMFAIALAVAAIPEALNSIVTIVLAFGTQKMAKENAVVRRLQAVEALGSVSVICSDKTGTLTQNKMKIKYLYTCDHLFRDQEELPEDALQAVCFASLCNDAVLEQSGPIGDPTEIALKEFAQPYETLWNDRAGACERIDELPFDSTRKLMSTLHQIGDRRIMVTKGAVDVLLNRTLNPDTRKILNVNDDLSRQGLRILAVAYKEVEQNTITLQDENGLTFVGLFAMIDPPRNESMAAVAACRKAGIKPIMITGDHKTTAAAIARQLGILQEDREVLEGTQLDNLSDEELENQIESYQVYARVSPEHKIRIVRAWQKKGNIVAMTGDGVNDAPALKQADIGVAMGAGGTEVAKEAAAIVLTDDNFSTIVKAVEYGRNIFANIQKSVYFLLSGNMAGIFTVAFCSLLGLPLPFAPVHLLFINLLTDSLPAIALGFEKNSAHIMQERPRDPRQGILDKWLFQNILLEGFLISAVTMAAFLFGLREGGPEAASTMAFITLCFSRLLHGFTCRTKQAVFDHENTNPYLWGAFLIGGVLLACVIFIPGLSVLFQISLDKTLLISCFLFSLFGFAFISIIRKVSQKTWNVKLEL